MPTAGVILLIYFLGGLFILIVFDLITKRIRLNLSSVGLQAQLRMAEANHPIGRKSGLVLMLALTWLAWPAVLIGALTQAKEDQAPRIQNRTDVIGAGARARWSYLVKKIWYGECPDCHIILTPLDAWGQYSECPQCKTTFHGFRMKAKKEEHNGETRQGTDSEDRGGEGEINITAGERGSSQAGEQPNRAPDTEESKP